MLAITMLGLSLPTSHGFALNSPSSTTSIVPSSTTALFSSIAMPFPGSNNNGPSFLPPLFPRRKTNNDQNKDEKENQLKQQRRQQQQQPQPQEVLTLDEFKTVVDEETEQIIVVKYYAPWCRACKAMSPSYKKIVEDYGGDDSDKSLNIKFVDAPMTSVNSEIHQAMGITTIPFAQIYHPKAGLVEERKIGRRYFSDFKKVLQSLEEGSCALMSSSVTKAGADHGDNDDSSVSYAASPYKEQQQQQQLNTRASADL